MSVSASVQEYVAKQDEFAWKRRLIRFAIRTIGFHVLARVQVEGEDNIPPDGPTIIMMNHISLADPVICMGALTHRFVVPMTKIENMRNPVLAPFIRWWGAYSVNRGEIDRKALMNSIELVKSGQLILIAPEGHRHPEGLSRPKDGLAYIATKANAVIVPMGIGGAEVWMHKLKRLRRAHVTVKFGRAFRFKLNGERIPRETLGAMSEEAMYQLASTIPDPALRGVYSDLSQATSEHIEFLGAPA
ncbi:MAG: 1-acyl-sn-glycerol-3-phosphate acyltransferase [Anaerolineae bacterium]|nr:1-acyl-sn-glycerol-3-phosphate acyltransferase [Anaerolineae bacterium]